MLHIGLEMTNPSSNIKFKMYNYEKIIDIIIVVIGMLCIE